MDVCKNLVAEIYTAQNGVGETIIFFSLFGGGDGFRYLPRAAVRSARIL